MESGVCVLFNFRAVLPFSDLPHSRVATEFLPQLPISTFLNYLFISFRSFSFKISLYWFSTNSSCFD